MTSESNVFSTLDNKRFHARPHVDPKMQVAIMFTVEELEDADFGIGLTQRSINDRIAYKARQQAQSKGLLERS